MHIGILKTDTVRPEWVGKYGEYPDMFKHLLNEAQDGLSFSVWDAEAGVLPNDDEIDSVCGFIITGSKSSVYDDKQWIRDLEVLIFDLHARRKKMVGICFGHQLIADELGGRTEAATSGWGVGAHLYDIVDEHWCMAPAMRQYRVLVSHKDQVTALPEGATLLASSEFCPNAMFTIADHVFALQGHPEFLPGYSEDLMNMRRDMIGEEVYQTGIASLEHDLQSVQVAQWMVHFLKGDQSV